MMFFDLLLIFEFIPAAIPCVQLAPMLPCEVDSLLVVLLNVVLFSLEGVNTATTRIKEKGNHMVAALLGITCALCSFLLDAS